MTSIKVSRRLLEDKELAEIFRQPIGVQIYLMIGSTHLRSQYFNSAILLVTRHLLGRKRLPKTWQDLQTVFYGYGASDPAARSPWQINLENEDHYSGRKDDYAKRMTSEAKDRNDKKRAEQAAHFQELLDALNGVDPWLIEWTL